MPDAAFLASGARNGYPGAGPGTGETDGVMCKTSMRTRNWPIWLVAATLALGLDGAVWEALVAPGPGGVLHRGMVEGGEEESEARLVDGPDGLFPRQVDGDAHGLEDIGAPRFGGNGAVSVLGDEGAARGEED